MNSLAFAALNQAANRHTKSVKSARSVKSSKSDKSVGSIRSVSSLGSIQSDGSDESDISTSSCNSISVLDLNEDPDSDSDSEKSVSTHGGGAPAGEPSRKKGQRHSNKLDEKLESFKLLPKELQKLELEREKTLESKWKAKRGLISLPVKEQTQVKESPAKKGLPPGPDIDGLNVRKNRDQREEDCEPPPNQVWRPRLLEIGKSYRMPNMDIRIPIVIDPLATVLPPQSRRLLSVGDLSKCYQEFYTEDCARDMHKMGIKVDRKLANKFERERKREEGILAPKPFDLIPFDKFNPISYAIPKPQIAFLDIVTVSALDYLPGYKIFRPYDWIPTKAGKLDNTKTLPAIFWSNSDKGPFSVIFYIFPTTQNIRNPISIGIVDGDQGLATISLNTTCFMSEARKKTFFSGYIDFSRPMIVPHEVISTATTKAKANEENFWDIWKGLFKKPSFGGHQYGMTPETRPFENPFRLMQLFESKMGCNWKYTTQIALAKKPLHVTKREANDKDSDCSSDDGSETVVGCEKDKDEISTVVPPKDEDDIKTVVLLKDEEDVKTDVPLKDEDDVKTVILSKDEDDAKTIVPSKDCNKETNNPSGSGSLKDGHHKENLGRALDQTEEQPQAKVLNWLDAVFERPNSISVDEAVKVVKSDEIHEQPKINPTYEPLGEVTVSESSSLPSQSEVIRYTDSSEYIAHSLLENPDAPPKQRAINGFEARMLKLMNYYIGPGGFLQVLPVTQTANVYSYPHVEDTKDLLLQYRKECQEVAIKAQIEEEGDSKFVSREFPWDEEVLAQQMNRKVNIKDVLQAWNKFKDNEHVHPDNKAALLAIQEALESGQTTVPAFMASHQLTEQHHEDIDAAKEFNKLHLQKLDEVLRLQGERGRHQTNEHVAELRKLNEELKELQMASKPPSVPTETMENLMKDDLEELTVEEKASIASNKAAMAKESPWSQRAKFTPNSKYFHRLYPKKKNAAKKNLPAEDITTSKNAIPKDLSNSDEVMPKGKSLKREDATAQETYCKTSAPHLMNETAEEIDEGFEEEIDFSWVISRLPGSGLLPGRVSVAELTTRLGMQGYNISKMEKQCNEFTANQNLKVENTACPVPSSSDNKSTDESTRMDNIPTVPKAEENSEHPKQSNTISSSEIGIDVDEDIKRTSPSAQLSLTSSPQSERSISPPLTVYEDYASLPNVFGLQDAPEETTVSATSSGTSKPESVFHQSLKRIRQKAESPPEISANRLGNVGKIRIPELFEKTSSPPSLMTPISTSNSGRRDSYGLSSRPVRQNTASPNNPAVQQSLGESFRTDNIRRRFQTASRRGGMHNQI
ncbi:hypothetical protein AA313_de0201054 [Arthrobotrys entomopaga]|nr:hypothetical protein AA313_de0201054 [Arthrobotrys entomopaga]